MIHKMVEFMKQLPREEMTKVYSRIVSRALRYIGVRMPQVNMLAVIRHSGDPGTEQQCRSAKREARYALYVSQDTCRTLASWAAADDPSRLDVESFLTWFQHLYCDCNPHLDRCAAVSLAMATVAEFVANECVYPTKRKVEA